MTSAILTGHERTFGENELLVSKTDMSGRITYANDLFCRLAGYPESELIGAAHSIVRHPAMPRCVFNLLWDTIAKGQEVFAYVLNLARNGDEYWVFAHVTPSYDPRGLHVGYHSNRRVPHDDAIARIKPIYAALCAEEKKYANPKDAIRASTAVLVKQLNALGMDYSQFVFSLSRHTTLEEVSA